MLALASLMSSCKLAPFSSLFLSTPFLSSFSSITLKKNWNVLWTTNFLHELQSCWFLPSFLYNIEMHKQKSIQACKILSFLKPKLHGFNDVRNRQWQVYCFWLDKKLSMNSIHVELKWVSEFGTPFGPLCFFFLMPSFWSCLVNQANTGFWPHCD
jgi:hypothetical protein